MTTIPELAELAIRPGVIARPLTLSDAPAMHALIVENRAHLDRWLRWSGPLLSEDDVSGFIAMFEDKQREGKGFHLGIWMDGAFAGGVVCWRTDWQNRNAEIGYWLGRNFLKRGLATEASLAVTSFLFDNARLHRLEMQCGVENRASRAVAERCGFVEEGIRRDSHWITNRFVDHVVYARLNPADAQRGYPD